MALASEDFNLGEIAYREYQKIQNLRLQGLVCPESVQGRWIIKEELLEKAHTACNAMAEIISTDGLISRETRKSFENIINEFNEFKASIAREIFCSSGKLLSTQGQNHKDREERFPVILSSLSKFIKVQFDKNKGDETQVHPSVFTLNYDDLLYCSLYEFGCLSGDPPMLVDGLCGNECIGEIELAQRLMDCSKFSGRGGSSGYFMHLHGLILHERCSGQEGSFLFHKKPHFTNPEEIKQPLIILTAPKHKKSCYI